MTAQFALCPRGEKRNMKFIHTKNAERARIYTLSEVSVSKELAVAWKMSISGILFRFQLDD